MGAARDASRARDRSSTRAIALHGVEVARHHREGLAAAALGRAQPRHRRRVERIAGQLKPTQALHRHDAAFRERRHRVVQRGRNAGAAHGAGVGFRMKAAVGGSGILRAARVAEGEPRHGRIRPVVGHGGGDGVARTAIRAVGEGVAIAAVRRVEQLPEAIGTGGQIGRDEGERTGRHLAGQDVEAAVTHLVQGFHRALDYARVGGSLGVQRGEKRAGIGAFDVDDHAPAGVPNTSRQGETFGQAFDERPEPDSLDHARECDAIAHAAANVDCNGDKISGVSQGSRRTFLRTAALSAAPLAGAPSPAPILAQPSLDVPLDGTWQFRLDGAAEWADVQVPHTWQTRAETAAYLGVAWYRRRFHAPPEWRERTVRVEFEAVYHSAAVSVNGTRVGEHKGKGYTAFTCDITRALKAGDDNVIEVRADNAFNDGMLPRGKSYDWTPDGGIYRPVRLLVTPRVYIERIDVDAVPDLAAGTAEVRIRAVLGGGAAPVRCVIAEEASGRVVAETVLAAGEGTVTRRAAQSSGTSIIPTCTASPRRRAGTGWMRLSASAASRSAMAGSTSTASASGCTASNAWRAAIRNTAWRNRRSGSSTITMT